MVRISRGKVDPVTGNPVTPEIPPVPSNGNGNGNGAGVRRSATHQPSHSGDRGRITGYPKSATMPTSTPNGTRNQQGQRQQGQQQGRNSWGGGRKQPQEWRGRAAGQAHPSKKDSGGGGGGGGLLKDMFERARSRAEDKKENLPPNELDAAAAAAAALQDVSEIVLACGLGKTPARVDRASGSSGASATTAAAVLNPFAKKPKSTAAAAGNPSPSDFCTPPAVITVGAVRSTGDAAPLAGYAGGDSDAWSRLSKGCLAAGARDGEDGTAVLEEGDASPRDNSQNGVTPRIDDSKAGGGASGTVLAAAESAGVKPVAPKRSLSAPSRGGSYTGSRDRGKKNPRLGGGGRKSQSRPPPAGKGATMLSFFGRAAVSKP